MNGNNENFGKALDIINQRRNKAKAINDRRFEEVNEKIPEIREINGQLAKTGMEILGILRGGGDTSRKLEELKQRNLQAQEMVRRLLTENGYPDDYLRIRYSCEKCGDTGFIDGKRCECLKTLAAKLSAESMNAGSQIKLCSFESFRISYYMGRDPEETEKYRGIMSRILGLCKRYAEDFEPHSSGNILMFGKTGLGKSHLSLSIASEVLKKGYNVLYDSALNYLRKVEREHFGRNENGDDTLEMLNSCDLLILDDLGSEYDTPFYVSTMYNVINTRLNREMPTIISTNLNHEGIQKKYDDRIVSRLFASYECYEFVGRDIRLVKRKNEH